MEYIRKFDDIRKEDVMSVGGKGANLGEMKAAGLAVPDGFVVTADAYRTFMNENRLDDYIQKQIACADTQEQLLKAAEALRTAIRNGIFPSDLAAAIVETYKKMGTPEVRAAVRSSATAEDLPDASFAGQQETYLNVTGSENILERIRECYASLWSDRAVIYRRVQGYAQDEVALAAVVQEMVESETSGVMFTANPVTGNRDEIEINASYGLGESVVSGKVTPDSYLCDHTGRLRKAVTGEKKTQIIYCDNGTEEVPVSEEMRKRRALSDEEVKELCLQGIAVENHYGMPMDIEWAEYKGSFYILQARAITTLKKEDHIPEEVWKKYYIPGKSTGQLKENLSFLLEKMNNVFLPFDYDIGKIINEQKSVIFSEVGFELDMHPTIDSHGIMNLPPNSIKLTRKIFHLPAELKEIKDHNRCRKIIDGKMSDYKKELEGFSKLDFEHLTLEESIHWILWGSDFIRRVLYSRFKYAMFAQILMNRRCLKIVRKADPTKDNYDLLQDLNNKTAEVTRDLEVLAEVIRNDPELKKDTENGMCTADLSSRYPAFHDEFLRFMDRNGFKTDSNCYCLLSRSYYEDPDRVLQIIRPMLKRPASKDAGHAFTELMTGIRHIYGEKKYPEIKQYIDDYRSFHVIREDSQYLWETIFFYMKKLHSRASELLCGDSDYQKCTAWLFLSELTEVGKNGELGSYREVIKDRIEMHPVAVKVWEESKMSIFSDDGEVMKGTGCSAGTAVGRVCTVSGPEEFWKLQKGDILVCRLTDPEWTPLFTLASAVVADTGAELSHASIVAREYGIPAVLGVGVATAKLKDGDQIKVDGTRGEVIKVN